MRKFAFLRLNQAVIAGIAVAVGGCSADVARFDFGSNTSFNDQTASIPAPTAPMKSKSMLGGDESASAAASSPEGNYSDGGAYLPAPSTRRTPIKMSALPEPVGSSAAVSKGAVAAANSMSAVSPVAGGETIEVKQGDTLFGLSKRHGVSVGELMSANRLAGPNLKLGQKLIVPGGKAAVAAAPIVPSPVADAPSSSSPPEPAQIAAAEVPSDWSGSYTVKPGDSVYAVARAHKIKPDELQRYNGITDVRKMKPGMVLKMPGPAGSDPAVASSVSVTPPQVTAPEVIAAPAVQTAPQAPTTVAAAPLITNEDTVVNPPSAPKMINAAKPEKTAAVQTPVMTDAGGSASSGKMRWPVQGKIISNFGPRSDGTHNDGVNLAVPMGTEIHAAEDGTVAYAGSELKGYGNLVLVRHENGWVTAYAHSDQVLVSRGDKVKRGQVIAKAGKTGSVDQPQVHFEVRQGQKPMDPAPYMEKI